MFKINLHKTYQSKQRISKISCKAEFVLNKTTAIYGKSGIGKSTILRIIAGLEKPDKGIITFENKTWVDTTKSINLPIIDRNIGFVFQDFNLFPNMTVEANLKYASNNNIPDAVVDLIEHCNISRLFKNYPHELSGGQRQHVSIIRSLCQNPKLLLLDEPFSALDDHSIGALIREIKLIQQRFGTTVILISHRKDVILEMADYVVIMKDELTCLQGVPSDLLTHHF